MKELTDELRKRGMKVIGSFHSFSIWGPITEGSATYLDPNKDYTELYRANKGKRSDKMLQGWYERVTEAVDKYKLDMVWFDTGFGGTVGPELRGNLVNGRLLDSADNSLNGIKEQFQQRLICHYYNKGIEWEKEVESIYESFDIPPGIRMRDIENGSLKGLQYDPWMADIDMAHHYKWPSTWFYN